MPRIITPALPFCHVDCRHKRPPAEAIPKELKTLGNHILAKRILRGIEQREVAEIIGVTESTVWNWEYNRAKPSTRYVPAAYDFIGYCLFEPGCGPDPPTEFYGELNPELIVSESRAYLERLHPASEDSRNALPISAESQIFEDSWKITANTELKVLLVESFEEESYLYADTNLDGQLTGERLEFSPIDDEVRADVDGEIRFELALKIRPYEKYPIWIRRYGRGQKKPGKLLRSTRPELKQVYAEFHDQSVEFLGMDYDPSKRNPSQEELAEGLVKAKELVQKCQIPWPQATTPSILKIITKRFRISSWPTLIMLDTEGNMTSFPHGKDELRNALEEALR